MTALPSKRSPGVREEIRTDVYIALRRQLVEWRDDADRLAVVAAAYALGGWSHPDWEIEDSIGISVEGTLRWTQTLPRGAGLAILDAALRGRNRWILRHRGEGLFDGGRGARG